MIEIDGAYLEGGGQIVRTALALSALTTKPFRIIDIRKGRKHPGLKHQHLRAVEALRKISSAKVAGATLGSTELEFIPLGYHSMNLSINIETAGSICLLLQALLVPAVFGDRSMTIRVRGGTDTRWAIPIDYFKHVLVPHLMPLAKIQTKVIRRGYYPKGRGEVKLRVKPCFSYNDYDDFRSFNAFLCKKTPAFDLTKQRRLVLIKGVSHAAKDLMKAAVAERQAKSARFHLTNLQVPVNIEKEYGGTASVGSGITLWAIFSSSEEEFPAIIGSDVLGEKGKPAEQIGVEAAEALIREIESGTPVDRHLADQILPFMAFFVPSRARVSKITAHCRTNMYVIEKFLPVKYSIQKDNLIHCNN